MLSKKKLDNWNGSWRTVFYHGALWYVSVFFSLLIFGFFVVSIDEGGSFEILLWAILSVMWAAALWEFSWNLFSCLFSKIKRREHVTIYPTILKFAFGRRALTVREISWLVLLATIVYLVAILFWLAVPEL